jgi:L-lactate dehydrogenase complex protein LldE
MHVGLFIPCYVNQFYPQVGIATLELLEKQGITVGYPAAQTCCGQPMANAGFIDNSSKTCALFVENFAAYDYVVAPSASCVHHVRYHFNHLPASPELDKLRQNTFELCEFLVKVLDSRQIDAYFPHKVGLHQSCQGLRGLRLGKSSEIVAESFSLVESLLQQVRGIELIAPARADECCGFGGTFSVVEEAVSVRMGCDRVNDHLQHGAQVMTAVDMSCLMHLEGIIHRRALPIKVKHVAEILNGDALQAELACD